MASDEMSDEKCAKCKIDFNKDKIIGCEGFCGGWFHMKCAPVTEQQYTAIKSCKGIKWFCNTCYVKTEVISNKNDKKIIESIQNIQEQMEKLKIGIWDSYKEDKKIMEGKPSFADAVKRRNNEILIVQAKSNNKESTDIIKEIKDKISPVELGVSINNIKTAKNGLVTLNCEQKEDITKLKEEIVKKMGNEVTTKIPKKRNPQVKVIGIQEKIEKDELKEMIIKQNPIIENHKDKLEVKVILERNGYYTAILETEPLVFNLIMQCEKLKIGWTMCKVYEFVNILRCFKCCGYFHKAENCTNKKVCGVCGDDKHEAKECNSDKQKCVNCENLNRKFNLKYETNHTVYDKNCVVLKKKLELQQNKVQYSST